MKKLLALILALAMCLTLVACGGGNASSDDEEVYEFTLSMHDPLTSNSGKFYQNWADQIAEATDGRAKITLFGSSTLVPALMSSIWSRAVAWISAGAILVSLQTSTL